jgi:threonine/homoserine/homoserine lactone efflux protein
MFEVSLVVALALLQQCNNITPAQQLGGASLLYYLGNATMSTSIPRKNETNVTKALLWKRQLCDE